MEYEDLRRRIAVKFQNNENFAPDSKEITEKFQLVLSEFYPRFKDSLEIHKRC